MLAYQCDYRCVSAEWGDTSPTLVLEHLLHYRVTVPRPRLHDREHVLDVAEQLVIDSGLQRLTVRRLSTASGVPNGALYHAFGSLAALRAEIWLRAAIEFLDLQTELIEDTLSTGQESADDAVVAAADAPAVFAERRLAAARMLMTVPREQLLGPELPTDLADALSGLDQKLVSSVLCRLATAMWGRCDGASVEVITTCVVDLPTALFRRALSQVTPDGTVPITRDVRMRLAAAVRAVVDRAPPPRPS